MTLYTADKDGYSKGTDDFASNEVLSIGDTDGETFIRFSGLNKPLGAVVSGARLKFKAHNSDAVAASINISGLLGVPAPNSLNAWSDTFGAATLDLTKWKYDWTPAAQLSDGKIYPLGSTIILSRINLVGDFDVTARLTTVASSGYPAQQNAAMLAVVVHSYFRAYTTPITGTYDYRIKRVGTTLIRYHKAITATEWTIDDVTNWTAFGPEYSSLNCVVGIVFSLYGESTNQYESLGSMVISGGTPIASGQALYSNAINISRQPVLMRYQFMVYWDTEGGFGGGAAYSFLLDTRIGSCRLKAVYSGTSISAYYGVNGSWTLLYTIDNVGPNAVVTLNGAIYAEPVVIPVAERAECNAELIDIDYSGSLVYLTDSEMPTIPSVPD